jgi:hypothetical protein
MNNENPVYYNVIVVFLQSGCEKRRREQPKEQSVRAQWTLRR